MSTLSRIRLLHDFTKSVKHNITHNVILGRDFSIQLVLSLWFFLHQKWFLVNVIAVKWERARSTFSARHCSHDYSKSEWINEVPFKKEFRLSWTTTYIPVILAHHVDHKPYRKPNHFLTLTLFKIVFFPASSLCTDVSLPSEGGGTLVHRLPARHNLKSVLNTKWMVITRHQSHDSFFLDWKCSSRRSSGTVTVTGLRHATYKPA